MKYPWLRLYTEILNDPKVQLLDAELFRAWVNMLCIARVDGNDGRLPAASDIAFHLRCSVGHVDKVLGALVDAGLIDLDDGQYAMHNWHHRQYESDADPTALQRKRRQRSKDRDDERGVTDNVTDNVTDMSRVTSCVTSRTSHAPCHGNVTRTDTDTDTEPDTEAEFQENTNIARAREETPEPQAPEPAKPRRKPFQPPTLSDVTAYCQERHNKVDPAYWLDYYQARDWMVGRNKMVDWRAAVRTWERNGVGGKVRPGDLPPPPPDPGKPKQKPIVMNWLPAV